MYTPALGVPIFAVSHVSPFSGNGLGELPIHYTYCVHVCTTARARGAPHRLICAAVPMTDYDTVVVKSHWHMRTE